MPFQGSGLAAHVARFPALLQRVLALADVCLEVMGGVSVTVAAGETAP
jgi:hypothetical protein